MRLQVGKANTYVFRYTFNYVCLDIFVFDLRLENHLDTGATPLSSVSYFKALMAAGHSIRMAAIVGPLLEPIVVNAIL